jgi:hydrogenase maturation protease
VGEAPIRRTVVLALGNPLRGDDGAGPEVLRALEAEREWPAHVTLIDGGTAGLESALLLSGYDRAILIDAGDMRLGPGSWRRFDARAVVLQGAGGPPLAVHQAGLSEALRLGEALGILPDEIVLYVIQPKRVGWEPGLSEPVRAAVAAVCAAVTDEILASEG